MDMKNLDALTLESVEYIKTRTDLTPEIGLVLGSGLGGLADQLEDGSVIPYEEVPHFEVYGTGAQRTIGDRPAVRENCTMHAGKIPLL